eukprot:2194303-Rhodomonas_salina.2
MGYSCARNSPASAQSKPLDERRPWKANVDIDMQRLSTHAPSLSLSRKTTTLWLRHSVLIAARESRHAPGS